MIVFENFSLSTNIAADCEAKTNLPSNNTCGIDMSGKVVFLTGMGGCSDIQVDNVGGDGAWNGLCYHNPNNGDNVFNS